MFLSKFLGVTKYDIAISVAEEDIDVAKQIAAALKNRKISYYLYTEHIEEHIGEHIFEILVKVFGKNSKYVLMVTSKIFKQEYWGNIETMISRYYGRRKAGIFQVKLDKAEIDGFGKHIVYIEWKNNPEDIAGILKRRILKDWWIKFRKLVVVAIFSLAMAIGAVFFVLHPVTADIDNGDPISNHMRPDSITLHTKKLIPAGFITSDSINPDINHPNNYIRTDSFWIWPTEVTVAQYNEYRRSIGKPLLPQPYGVSNDNYPVVNISWYEADEFCKAYGGRLPTQAEWEYAADGNVGHKYAGGDGAGERAVYNRKRAGMVATKDSNAFGLYDMSGNVAEWCSDTFDLNTGMKPVRGGSFESKINPVNTLHLLFKRKENPHFGKKDIGFRIVWDH